MEVPADVVRCSRATQRFERAVSHPVKTLDWSHSCSFPLKPLLAAYASQVFCRQIIWNQRVKRREFEADHVLDQSDVSNPDLVWGPLCFVKIGNIVMETRSPLINALRRAANHVMPSLFQIDGCGSVSVYPQQNCYVTDIQDWDAAYQSHPEQFTVKSVVWGLPPSGALPLMELQWRAAYQCALRNQFADAQATDLLRLRSWPNLSRLPVELVAPVTQICALLWRKPAAGFLIPRVLHADSAQVGALLEVLQGFGHITVFRTVTSPQSESAASPDSGFDSQGAVDSEGAYLARPTDTLAGKLWRRLIGH